MLHEIYIILAGSMKILNTKFVLLFSLIQKSNSSKGTKCWGHSPFNSIQIPLKIPELAYQLIKKYLSNWLFSLFAVQLQVRVNEVQKWYLH